MSSGRTILLDTLTGSFPDQIPSGEHRYSGDMVFFFSTHHQLFVETKIQRKCFQAIIVLCEFGEADNA